MMHVYYTNSYDINDISATYADVDLDGAVRISVVLCSNEHSTGIRGTSTHNIHWWSAKNARRRFKHFKYAPLGEDLSS